MNKIMLNCWKTSAKRLLDLAISRKSLIASLFLFSVMKKITMLISSLVLGDKHHLCKGEKQLTRGLLPDMYLYS